MPSKNSYFSLNLIILKIAGIWIPDQGESCYLKAFYCIYNMLLICYSVVFFTPMELFAFKKTYYDTEKLMKNISVGGTHALAVLKVIVWFKRRREIIDIIKVLEAKANDYQGIKKFQPKTIIKQEKFIKNITTLVFLVLGMAVSVTAFIAAMWILLTDYKKYEYVIYDYETNTTTFQYMQPLPYHVIMPFIYDSSKLRFGISLIYNCFPAFHFAWIIIGIDTIFTALLSYISTHLRILQGAFRTIRLRSLQALQLENASVLHDSNELNTAMIKEMNKCVCHLQLIFRTCKKVEDIFTYLTLAQVLSSQILICACLYMVSAIPMASKAFATELIYLVAIEMQIALYCFFGNKVTLTGENISLALYEGDWLSTSMPFRKSMLITMARMKRPIYLTIGKFSPLTLATFLSIGKASYSFFAVIKKHKSK